MTPPLQHHHRLMEALLAQGELEARALPAAGKVDLHALAEVLYRIQGIVGHDAVRGEGTTPTREASTARAKLAASRPRSRRLAL